MLEVVQFAHEDLIKIQCSFNGDFFSQRTPITIFVSPLNKKFECLNEDYWIIDGKLKKDIKINANNLCWKILYELFGEEHKNTFISMPENLAKYLLDNTKTDEYAFKNGVMYDVIAVKLDYLSRLNKFNTKIQSEDAIKANEALIDIITEDSLKNSVNLIGSDLRFVGENECSEKVKKTNKVLQDAIPVYSCDWKQVSGYIKHVQNRLKKYEERNSIKNIEKIAKSLQEYGCVRSGKKENEIEFKRFSDDTIMNITIKENNSNLILIKLFNNKNNQEFEGKFTNISDAEKWTIMNCNTLF